MAPAGLPHLAPSAASSTWLESLNESWLERGGRPARDLMCPASRRRTFARLRTKSGMERVFRRRACRRRSSSSSRARRPGERLRPAVGPPARASSPTWARALARTFKVDQRRRTWTRRILPQLLDGHTRLRGRSCSPTSRAPSYTYDGRTTMHGRIIFTFSEPPVQRWGDGGGERAAGHLVLEPARRSPRAGCDGPQRWRRPGLRGRWFHLEFFRAA